MKLKNVDPTEFSEMYNNSFEPKQKVKQRSGAEHYRRVCVQRNIHYGSCPE